MARSSTLLLTLAVAPLGAACSTRQVSGAAVLAPASASSAPGRLKVRPNEVSWSLGDPVQVQAHIPASQLGAFTSTGVVWARGGGPLPDFVELASTRKLTDSGADGLLVTNWLCESKTLAGITTHHVQVWGLLLTMSDLGPMSEDRADLRETVTNLEAARLRMGGL